ncbi:hypothetical protein C8J56DRAFT_105389 [Mycena floridula]|nr:hypothetical protein C8J56DRAFT_105389 [Mycena floridula]
MTSWDHNSTIPAVVIPGATETRNHELSKLYHWRLSSSSPSTTMTSYPLQSLEELSDLETSSAIGHCIDDDEEFIRNARARTMVDVDAERMIKGGKRVAFLWYALRHLPDSLRKCVFLDLLQGSDDGEDIWLWNEGDEALLEWVVYLEEEDQPPPWTSAAAALERRLTRTPPRTLRRREVESAAFKMRAAMIGWLALTSAAYKSAGEERGVRDCEEWDMRGWIQVWYWGLPWRMLEWLDQCSKWYDHRAFTGAMDQAGHSCHQEIEKEVRWWLFMRSQLFPTQQDTIIHFRSEHCAPCLAHKPTCGCEPPPSWTPSLALVALRDMWDDIESHYDERRDFSQWLLGQPIYGMKEANEFLRSLPRDTDEDWYLSWINTYPRRLRRTVTQYTLAEWRDMDDCLTGSAHGGSLNIRSWWAAMHWRMMPPGLSHSAHVKQFIDAWRYSVDWRLEFLPLQSPAPEFRDAIRESGHTCWEESQMDNYAAAMAVLKEDPKVVGSCVREYSGCQVCELQWRLQEWGETLPVEEQAFSEDLTELLVMLRTECSRRKVAWDDILTSAQKEFINTDFSDFSEEAEISDAGSDVDEASGEDKRAPVAVIHPSQVNTAGHGENNPSSGLVQTEKVVDVEEESADAVRRPNFTNLPSENPHLYSIGPVNFGEAIIHGRQIHNSQQINALSTNSGGSHSGSDPSFGHIPDVSLQPSALDSIQNWPPNSSTNPQTYIGYQGGTLAPWNQGLPEGGSDPTVGRQQGYIGISASNSVEK